MTMARVVVAEALDNLAPDDPAAIRSRGDLRRVHLAMGTRAIVAKALRGMPIGARDGAPLRVLELGAGDGSLMLGVARSLAQSAAQSAPSSQPPAWPRVELTLLDRQRLVEPATLAGYAALGWAATEAVVDVTDWAAGPAGATTVPPLAGGPAARWDVIVANLFLHHFEGAPLATLLGAIAARCDHFFACEPHRAWLALAGSHLVGAIGANSVTRQDAVLSVHAGFRDSELSSLWPALWTAHTAEWALHEYRAGLFSHCFRADRTESQTRPGTQPRAPPRPQPPAQPRSRPHTTP